MFETTLPIAFQNVPHRILILEVEKKIIFFRVRFSVLMAICNGGLERPWFEEVRMDLRF